jgi:hypothetical protein
MMHFTMYFKDDRIMMRFDEFCWEKTTPIFLLELADTRKSRFSSQCKIKAIGFRFTRSAEGIVTVTK